MAESKQRTGRRRILRGVAVVAVAAVLVVVWHPWGSGHRLGVAASDTAIAQIPRMTRVVVHSVAPGTSACGWKAGAGFRLPRFCSALKARDGRYEAWILTTAYEQGSRLNVSGAFAKRHPGPVIVTDEWQRFASPREAALFMREPDLTLSYAGSHTPAVNGGVGRSMFSHLFAKPGWRGPVSTRNEIHYFWASGSTVVTVNVIGAELTAAEAQQIALLARPR